MIWMSPARWMPAAERWRLARGHLAQWLEQRSRFLSFSQIHDIFCGSISGRTTRVLYRVSPHALPLRMLTPTCG